jgi:hypothetical protein
MFRAADILNFSLSFSHATPVVSAETHLPKRTSFDSDEDIGALAHVYSEIARRLSRNAYTRHAGAR